MERVALVRCINETMRPVSPKKAAPTRNVSATALRLPSVTLKHVRDTIKLVTEEHLHRLQPYLNLYTHCYSWCVQEILLRTCGMMPCLILMTLLVMRKMAD